MLKDKTYEIQIGDSIVLLQENKFRNHLGNPQYPHMMVIFDSEDRVKHAHYSPVEGTQDKRRGTSGHEWVNPQRYENYFLEHKPEETQYPSADNDFGVPDEGWDNGEYGSGSYGSGNYGG